MTVRDLPAHIVDCVPKIERCACGQSMPLKQLATHKKNDCGLSACSPGAMILIACAAQS